MFLDKETNKSMKINNLLHSESVNTIHIQSNNEMRSRTLHILMRPSIILAQCLSLMPLVGICNTDPSNVRLAILFIFCEIKLTISKYMYN